MSWAVVLGASTGTGAAIARAVAGSGMDVFAVHRGRHPEQAAEVARSVEAQGRRCVLFEGDVSGVAGANDVAEAMIAVAGTASVSLLVHSLAGASVGRLASGDARQLTPRQVSRTFDILAHSFVYQVQALSERGLLAPGARILALTNPLDESLLKDCGLITAAKAALAVYVRALALELGPRGYRVNLLKFPTVVTPAVEVVYGARLPDVVEAHRRMHPAGRMCTVEEVARVVAWLAGPEAEWFNGATIDYSGAMMTGLVDILLGDGT